LLKDGSNLYVVDFSNKGGLVMPIILEVKYTDGTSEIQRISAQIWRKNTEHVSKLIITDKEVKEIVLDPYWETADVDVNNNYWPTRVVESRLELYKRKKSVDMMKHYNKKLKTDEDEDDSAAAKVADKKAS